MEFKTDNEGFVEISHENKTPENVETINTPASEKAEPEKTAQTISDGNNEGIKKRGRGRPPKNPNTEKPEVKQGEKPEGEKTVPHSQGKPLIQTLGEYNETNKPPTQPAANPAQNENIAHLLNGAMLLGAIDFILPGSVLFLMKKVGKGYEHIKANDIKLTKDEKKDLEPIAEAAVKQLVLNISPLQALFILLAFNYAGKIATLKK